MITIKDITEPIKVFPSVKDALHRNAEELFDNLIKQSETNVEANKATVAQYNKKLLEIEEQKKNTGKTKRKKGWMIFLCVLCFITIILIPVAIIIIRYIKNTLNVQLNDLAKLIEKKTQEAEQVLNLAKEQTARLNSLFDWSMVADLVNTTMPSIVMDKQFNNYRFAQLNEKYGYKDHGDATDISTVYVQSGCILGNPFVIEKNYVQDMYNEVYTGSLVISWNEYSDGRTIHHTQTLHATYTAPKPMYYLDTWLIYGNDAAPRLNFSRKPVLKLNTSEKDIEHMVKKFSKELDKKQRKDINFTQLANSEFECLFRALDRDNEQEFRLLFTPLGQTNMNQLIKSNEPYGDDFTFIKRKCLNYIKTEHSQQADYSSNPGLFINYDATKMKETFITYCDSYIQSFFFDLAPLMTIPLYVLNKSQEYIYRDNFKNRVTSFESESLLNRIDWDVFKPKDCATDLILKSHFVKSQSDMDVVKVTAHGFKSIQHTALVPVRGGDGYMHNVPVIWYEYLPVQKDSFAMLKDSKLNRPQYLNTDDKNIIGNLNLNNIKYYKGFIGGVIPNTNPEN